MGLETYPDQLEPRAAVGGYGVYAFHILAPLFLAVLAVASWALRQESRTIGILIPGKNGRPV
jgi:hypothetical protein